MIPVRVRRRSITSPLRRKLVTIAAAAVLVSAFAAAPPASAAPQVAAGPSEALPTPQLVIQPVVTGNPTVGERLTSTTGSWNPRSVSYQFQWLADGQAIAGANQSFYYATGADLSKRLSTVVSVFKAGYGAIGSDSTLSGVIQQGKARVEGPTIVDQPRVDMRLQGYTSTSTRGATLSFQWLRDGVVIPGATQDTYTPTQADLGTRLRFRATASGLGYIPATATSAASVVVVRG